MTGNPSIAAEPRETAAETFRLSYRGLAESQLGAVVGPRAVRRGLGLVANTLARIASKTGENMGGACLTQIR